MFYLYEIYTCNAETGEPGWDIEFVIALSREDVSTFPNFDCVIMQDGAFGNDSIAATNSGFPMTESVKEITKGTGA